MGQFRVKSHISKFKGLADGTRHSDLRPLDRDYQIGDIVIFEEGEHDAGEFKFTGNTVSKKIVDIDTYGAIKGWGTLFFDTKFY